MEFSNLCVDLGWFGVAGSLVPPATCGLDLGKAVLQCVFTGSLVGYALVGLLLVVQLGSWSMWGKTSGVLLAFVQLGHCSYSLGVLGA